MHILAFRGRRNVLVALAVVVTFLVLTLGRSNIFAKDRPRDKDGNPVPAYLPQPTWTPPPVVDPFPSLSTTNKPPAIPKWNEPKDNVHRQHGLDYAPPLFIGFTRTWPLLLQSVVSYITAGWPPSQIYVVENTGVQRSNALGKLTLQNPYFLNHTQLEKLGVNVIRAPVLMTFAQMQNYFIHLANENKWPYYFWSHMDVLALSYEEGEKDVTPGSSSPDYKTLYELSVAALADTIKNGGKWANRFFAYDHLCLVNRDSYEAVGGWDTFIPYYMSDCDMHSRLIMAGYQERDYRVGIVKDVSTVLKDLGALYRDPDVTPGFVDPNPPPPSPDGKKGKRDAPDKEKHAEDAGAAYFTRLRETVDQMGAAKGGDRDRSVWQQGQRGGEGEPFYYPARGIAQGIDVVTEAGREVYRRKWGHQHCDLISGAGLKSEDQWRVKPDW